MKQIVLCRHAKAQAQTYGMKDFDRKLSTRGKSDAITISEKIKSYNIVPQAIFSSPAKRALKTAQIFSKTLNFPVQNIATFDFMYNYFSTEKLFLLAEDTIPDKSVLFLFGHNPTFEELVGALTPFDHFLPTCACVGVEFDKVNNWHDVLLGTGKQMFFEYPKKYRQ